jgi:hypothetical protein
MYKIPLDANIERLIGHPIIQICFTLSSISIFFEKGRFITMECSFVLTEGTKQVSVEEVYPVKKEWGLLSLLEKKLINIQIDDDRTSLALYFEDNKTLKLLADPMYESYFINIDDNEIII